MSNKSSRFVLGAVGAVLVVLVIVIWLAWFLLVRGQQNLLQRANAPSLSSLVANMSDWKTLNIEDLGVRFLYPPNWPALVVEQRIEEYADVEGQMPAHATYVIRGQERVVGAPLYPGIVAIHAYPANWQPLEGDSLGGRPIDFRWSEQQARAHTGLGDGLVLFQKIGERSVLVGVYEAPECSPSLRLSVVTSLHPRNPNFEIVIDPLFYEYDVRLERRGEDPCDASAIYQTIAEEIRQRRYSEALDAVIQLTARVADAVTPISALKP